MSMIIFDFKLSLSNFVYNSRLVKIVGFTNCYINNEQVLTPF